MTSFDSDSEGNTMSDGRNDAMLKARIVYDYEVDEMARQGGLEVFPLIEHLFNGHPDADPQLVLYTAAEHVRVHGIPAPEDFPNELVEVPAVEPEEDYSQIPQVVDAETVAPVAPPSSEGEIEELSPLPEEYAPADAAPKPEEKVDVREQIRARRAARKAATQAKANAMDRNVNVRGVMQDIAGLDL